MNTQTLVFLNTNNHLAMTAGISTKDRRHPEHVIFVAGGEAIDS